MKRWMSSFFARAPVFGAAAPLLAAYLYVGACGGGRDGVVVKVKVAGVAITASWCEAPKAPARS